MAFCVDENGDITLVQGDSGMLVVEGLPTDANYKLFLAVQDKNRNSVGNEISVNANGQDCVTFLFTGDFTDLLAVGKNKLYENYYYGIKICDLDNNTEDTLIAETNDIGDLNRITVYPKKVEGI